MISEELIAYAKTHLFSQLNLEQNPPKSLQIMHNFLNKIVVVEYYSSHHVSSLKDLTNPSKIFSKIGQLFVVGNIYFHTVHAPHHQKGM